VAPLYSLSSVDAFAEAAARAAELGFTDVIVRWPGAAAAERVHDSVLQRVASDILPHLQSEPMTAGATTAR
jgi:hypothetical protein